MKYTHISEEKLVDYTLGRLPEEENLTIEQHLFTCEQCFQEWQGWQDVLSEDDVQRVPSLYLKQRVLDDVQGHVNKRKQPFMRKPAFAIVSVCVLFIIWLTINPFSGQGENIAYKGQMDRTVHPYPFDQEELVFKVSQLDLFNTLPAPNMIWIHNNENRPIVYVNEQGPSQLLDCQYIVVLKKQDWSSPTLIIRSHSEVYLQEKEDIYLRCVK